MIGNSRRVVSCKWPIFNPQNKCNFIENHPKEPPCLSFSSRLSVSGLLFFMHLPQPRQEIPWKPNSGQRGQVWLCLSKYRRDKNWITGYFPKSSSLADFYGLLACLSEAASDHPPALETQHHGTDASLALDDPALRPGSATFLTLSKSLTLY